MTGLNLQPHSWYIEPHYSVIGSFGTIIDCRYSNYDRNKRFNGYIMRVFDRDILEFLHKGLKIGIL